MTTRPGGAQAIFTITANVSLISNKCATVCFSAKEELVTTATLDPTTLAPTELEAAATAARDLDAILPAKPRPASRVTLSHAAEPGRLIEVPAQAVALLVTILDEMARGNAVTVMPTQMEVTTQQAANLLNVSRPHVVKLLEEKKIPSRRVGNRRRIRLSDLIAFKRRDEGARQKIVDELANEAQELGIY